MFGAAKLHTKTTMINSDLGYLVCSLKPKVDKSRKNEKNQAKTNRNSKTKLVSTNKITLSKEMIKFSADHDFSNTPLFTHTHSTILPPMRENPSHLRLSPSSLKLSVHNLAMESTLAATDPTQHHMYRTARKPTVTVKSLSPKINNATQFGQFRYNRNKDNAIVGNGDFVSTLKHSPSQADKNEFL